MGLKGIFRFFKHRFFELFVVVLLITFLPHLPPYTNFSESYRVSPAKPFQGKLALNEKLNDVEIWHKGDLVGPEAFADYNGELYVSLHSGDVAKLTGNHITPIVRTGKPCKGQYEERICGRPLGLQFNNNGILYVADAYYGIYKVDVKTGDKTLIVSVDQDIDGKKPKVPNSIALTNDGDIYWTDSSTEFLLEDGVFDVLADPSGRLIHYNVKTKENKVLLDKLHFANGVALSENEEFIVVAETARNRLIRYYLKGPKKGSHDIFIDGLPGCPDNLKADGKGGFLVPLIIAVDSDNPSPSQMIAPFPLLRKLISRVLGLTQLGFETINKVYPCEFAQRAVHFIGHLSSASTTFAPARVTVLHLDKSGEILDSLHGLNKKIHLISETHIFKDTLYLGSPFNNYIAKVPLSKIGWQHLTVDSKKREAPVEERKAGPSQTTTAKATTTTTRPPTTTTPPPTTTVPRTTTTTPPTATTPRTTTTSPPPKTTTQAPTTPKTNTPSEKDQSDSSPPKQQARPAPTLSSTQPQRPTQKPTTQSPPPVVQPTKDHTKSVPIKESSKTKK